MNPESPDLIQLNGEPARAEDLRWLVQTNYGHFTAMQVREGCVRGLELHLDRLESATRELFATTLDRERVRDYLRRAIGTELQPLALRVSVFSRALDRDRMTAAAQPDVLILASTPSSLPPTPLRLKSFTYARDLASIKHVGTFPLFHYRRLAQQAGFDDALFVDESGYISEGSIWNIGFANTHGVVWPDAPQLAGVSMQLLQAGLARNGVSSTTRSIALHEVPQFLAAFFTNSSTAVRPIACIDEVGFAVDATLNARLTQCYETNPWERV